MSFFGCAHRNQTTPRRDEAGNYRRCNECGARLPWQGWPLGKPPQRTQEGKSYDRAARELEKMMDGKWRG